MQKGNPIASEPTPQPAVSVPVQGNFLTRAKVLLWIIISAAITAGIPSIFLAIETAALNHECGPGSADGSCNLAWAYVELAATVLLELVIGLIALKKFVTKQLGLAALIVTPSVLLDFVGGGTGTSPDTEYWQPVDPLDTA
jgi:hypothetical protein